jgi:hypothetical protein
MRILNDKESKIAFEEVRARNKNLMEDWLKEAKLSAASGNKEVFDYEKLKTLVDVSYFADAKTPEQEKLNLEYKYYVENPDLMTIEDFSNLILEFYKWCD